MRSFGRIGLYLSIMLLSVLCLNLWAQPTGNRPNVILIMADDMGMECLGANGALSYQTPVLDDLAARGVHFLRCHSQPVCTPSRVKIMTGQYNYRNYVDFGFMDPEEHTFGHLMKRAGYKTCVAGKWQLNGAREKEEGYDDRDRPHQFGFDEYCLWQLTTKGPRYANPYIEQNGELLETSIDDYGPDIVCDYILDFIDRSRDGPFFVYYPMILVHSPFVPTPDSEEWADKERRGERHPRFFADMVNYADKIVGRIMARLQSLDLEENTIVLFVGDNGTHTSITTDTKEGPYPGGKSSMRDNGTHVPMVAYYPAGGKGGEVVDGLADFSDFYPTLADAAGLSNVMETDGRSFLPAIGPGRFKAKRSVFIHYDPYTTRVQEKDGRLARNHRFKLYHDDRFYDLEKDRWEQAPLSTNNLTGDARKAYRKLSKVLRGQAPVDFALPARVRSQ